MLLFFYKVITNLVPDYLPELKPEKNKGGCYMLCTKSLTNAKEKKTVAIIPQGKHLLLTLYPLRIIKNWEQELGSLQADPL